jgi:lipopolysaccharide biosynthesis glycosyltransferase
MKESASKMNNLLVTLADRNFIAQAKQLFSSAYWNGGWRGDFLLLAHEDVPEAELSWFKQKGILVFPCKALSDRKVVGLRHPSVVLDKFYLFTPYFKKWDRVVFLDADIIVRASLERLEKSTVLFSVPSANKFKLRDEFLKPDGTHPELFEKLKKNYSMNEQAFNSGVMAFRTEIIESDTLDKLLALYWRFDPINRCGEETALNLFFYRQWKLLSILYNAFPFFISKTFHIAYPDIRCIVLHPAGETTGRPWLPTSPFYGEWLANLRRAETMDVNRPQKPAVRWTPAEERKELKRLMARKFWFNHRTLFRLKSFFGRLIGKVGLKKNFISTDPYARIMDKNKPKNPVLVTLADRNFVAQAKQLFSSAYWNGGWRGDYILLAHGDISDEGLSWFRSKNIIVFRCEPLTDQPRIGLWHPPVVLDKFYLFTPFFKKWDRVVFLDADIIVRASLDGLLRTEAKFVAPRANGMSLRGEFMDATKENAELFMNLEEEFPLNGDALSSGVMSFDTELIQEGTFAALLNLFHRFGGLSVYGDEATLNLFFRDKWRSLSMLYNIYPFRMHNFYDLPYEKIQAIIIHFVQEAVIPKPWLAKSPFYAEWRANLENADGIDIKNPLPAAKIWTVAEENRYLRSLRFRRFFRLYRFVLIGADWLAGQVGLLLKRNYPRLYEKLRPKKHIA